MSIACSRVKSSTPRTRPGFTLLEVLVGAVLLATLAVTVLLGFSEHRRQLSFSEQRIAVTVELDRLLRDWSSQPKGVPRNAMGLVEPGRSWWWTTRVVQQ
ncbi:MAG: prepilin-type N-terminal cleavage/methylation domain-containing protein, partial [bacterium]